MIVELKYLTYPDVKDLIKDGWRRLLIPVGTLEPHGPHLPLGTDSIIPHDLAVDIAGRIRGLVAPTIEYGVVNSLLGYPGSTSIGESTLERLIVEIILGFSKIGFKYYIILNGHGGNIEPIRAAQRILWREHNIKTISIHWWIEARDITRDVYGETGAHAGVDETAIILHKHPELVKIIDVSNSVLYVSRGFDAYPTPGTILVYEKEMGLPNFDKKLASRYYREVLEHIIRLIEMYEERLDDI